MKKVLAAFAFVFALAVALPSQAQVKVAHADADSILSSLPEFKAQLKTLETYGKQLNSTLEAKQKEFQTKYQDYLQNEANWIPEIIQEKQRELQQLDQGLREFEQTSRLNLARKEEEIMAPLREKIRKGIEDVAKEMGYAYVLPGTALLYANPADDITSAVIKKLGGK